MCGIFGCVSNKNVVDRLITGLKKLEYRGYDSSGIAIIEADKMAVIKSQGYITKLEAKAMGHNSNIGIAHTRWSTHGKPTYNNAHPHTSGKFALVHNGIIENFATLKAQLQAKGVNFCSETDTEVIVHLLNHIYTGDLLHSLQLVSKLLIGSYALAVIDERHNNRIIVTRKDSPLIIGRSTDSTYISSDAVALSNICDEQYLLNDEEFAIIESDKVEFFDNSLNCISKDIATRDIIIEDIDIENTESFMLKEMLEIPTAIFNTIAYYRSGLDKSFTSRLIDIEEIIILGCGTAYHAGVIAGKLIEQLARIPTRVEIASEFRYSDPIIKKNTLVLAISQSGETADTIAGVKYAKSDKNTALVCAITNVCTSNLVKYCDYVFPTIAGVEIAVAATKSYNTQLAVIYILVDAMAKSKGYSTCIAKCLPILPQRADEVLTNYTTTQGIASQFFTSNNVFFLGRSLDYATALEGSLKLKEISYLYSEGYPAGELKHGTLALIEENSLVVVIITQHKVAQKTINALHEVKARGARVLLITQLKEYLNFADADFIIQLPIIDDILMPILSIMPLQMLAYYMAKEKGNDPDRPRNLAKSVTVE